MSEEIAKLKSWIAESNNIVFFGGAGVSTESGIPDFRSADGLYNLQYRFPPEEIISHSFFKAQPEEFFRFYRDKLVPSESIQPNAAHRRLAELEAAGKLRCVITQNIDGLHQKAGSHRVIELHGSVHRAYCERCYKPFPASHINEGEGVPHCDCGGIVRPDVVLYEEGLEEKNLSDAVEYIRSAEVLIVGGTSLSVYPAAGLIRYYRGSRLALINRSVTPYDDYASLVIREPIGKVFSEI